MMIGTFKERLGPLVGSGLTKEDMNSALVYCGVDEFIDSLEKQGFSKLESFSMLGAILNELSLFDNERN